MTYDVIYGSATNADKACDANVQQQNGSRTRPLGVAEIFAACFTGLGAKYLKTRKNAVFNE